MSEIFKPEALEELFSIEASLVSSLIVEFKASAPTMIANITESQNKQDYKKLELHSHSLKSSARVLGFNKMADDCAAIEHAAHGQSSLPEVTARLTPSYHEAVQAIERFMQGRTS